MSQHDDLLKAFAAKCDLQLYNRTTTRMFVLGMAIAAPAILLGLAYGTYEFVVCGLFIIVLSAVVSRARMGYLQFIRIIQSMESGDGDRTKQSLGESQ